MSKRVSVCPISTQNKFLHQCSFSLLQHSSGTLSTLDFVTGLPKTEGNAAILTVIDRFSQMVCLILLPEQPSAKKTAKVMLAQVFRIHGFPLDIVSDMGLQFISGWESFGFSDWNLCQPFPRLSAPIQWIEII